MLTIDMAKQNKDRIYNIYSILQRKLKKYGKNIALPKNTDHTKTYSWRYLQNFVKRMDDMGICEAHIPLVIEAIIEHARERRLLSRGFAILSKIDIINLVVLQLERDLEKYKVHIDNVRRSHEFMLTKQRESSKSIFELLTEQKKRDSYINMTCWYEQGFLSLEYLALSRNCRKALLTVKSNPGEFALFPETKKLMQFRLQLLAQDEIVTQAKDILNEDLFAD